MLIIEFAEIGKEESQIILADFCQPFCHIAWIERLNIFGLLMNLLYMLFYFCSHTYSIEQRDYKWIIDPSAYTPRPIPEQNNF